MRKRNNKKHLKITYPSPEVYDHVQFKRKKKKEIVKDRNVWYLTIVLVVLMVVSLIIITIL